MIQERTIGQKIASLPVDLEMLRGGASPRLQQRGLRSVSPATKLAGARYSRHVSAASNENARGDTRTMSPAACSPIRRDNRKQAG